MLSAMAVVTTVTFAGNAVAQEGAINIGLISSLSGPIGDQGTEYANGLKLAIGQINDAGGVAALGGRKIYLNVADDTSVPAISRTLAIRLLSNDGASLLLGPYGSGPCLAAGPVAELGEHPMICSAASDKPTSQGYKYVFNRATLAGSYTEAGFAALKELSESSGVDLRKVAIIYEDGAYGTSGNEQADSIAAKYSITLTDHIAFHTNTPDLSPFVSRAVASGAKSILIFAYTGDAVNLVRAVRLLKAPLLVLASGATNVTMVKLGQIADGVVAVGDWNDDLPKPDVAPFVQAYKAKYASEPSMVAAWGYSDGFYVKEVLSNTGSTDPKALRDTIARLKVTAGPAVGIMPYDSYGFDDDGLAMNQLGRVVATQVQNGRMVTIWPGRVATAKLDTSTLK